MVHPEALVQQALSELGIAQEHDAASLRETRVWLSNPGLDDPTLLDLTDLPFVTIDNVDSRDLDQALLIEKTPGAYRVRYALADAAYYIRPGSALFHEALSRGTSFYTPVMAVPMLPRALSEGLISLNPDVDRRALVFDISLAEDTTVRRCSIVRARIRSRAKLNYQAVQVFLDSDAEMHRSFDASLQLLKELGEKLIQASLDRGVVLFDRREARIEVTGSPPAFHAQLRDRLPVEKYNEQLSLLCNMQGARLLIGLAGRSTDLQAIFRVHDAPLRERLEQLRATLTDFSKRQAQAERWRWTPGQSLAAYVDQLPQGEQNRRLRQAVQKQIMLAQTASMFSPEASRHHALKADSYARFSSPMREIVGVFTHKELLEAFEQLAVSAGGDQLSGVSGAGDEALRVRVIESANRARRKQRQLDKKIEFAALSALFQQDISSCSPVMRSGTIVGMRSNRLYVSLDEFAMDVKVYLQDLDEQFGSRYQTDGVLACPDRPGAPSFALGQGIRLKVLRLDTERQRYCFAVDQIDD